MEEFRKERRTMTALTLLSAVLMSVPYLVPHTGWVSLFALVPLLCMERIAEMCGIRKVWRWHFSGFVIWNALTTFWVCNATVGGGVFAIVANAFQMSVVFGLFRLGRKAFRGSLPYVFLAALWIAWEKMYFSAQISWPWLTLGNAFARSTGIIQWYEYTGTLGGSLWVWASNLGIFGLMCSLSDGTYFRLNAKAKSALIASVIMTVFAPMAVSRVIWHRVPESPDRLDVAVLQPNFDPYDKFTGLDQDQQNAILEGQIRKVLADRAGDRDDPLLLLAPETFTSDVVANDIRGGKTWRRFRSVLEEYPGVSLIFGASSVEYIASRTRPSHTARPAGNELWRESHNSALIVDGGGNSGIFHKNKLVVGVEMTPYPSFFCKVDDMLGGVMGRCIGQGDVSLLTVRGGGRDIPAGCAICYESVYGDYCRAYVLKGAELMTVITNDAWWGDTPGYRQHLSYACLRAIELRRDIVRCGNTGISALIDSKGSILEQTRWSERTELSGSAGLSCGLTFFARNGDMTGRLCSFVAVLLLAALCTELIKRHG